MSVFLSDEQTLPTDSAMLRRLAELVMEHERYPAETEVTIMLVSDEAIADYNQRFMERAGPTDVLAFPLDELVPGQPPRFVPGGPPVALGDVIIAPSYVRRQAEEHDSEFSEEIALMVIHGMLHLMGYDHGNDEDAEAMEEKERTILAGVGMRRP
jgi:probable rRNA maturation factor